ncbi:MAG: hypothetical protein Kow0098_08600 [Ignavibacteriaceae bacterium]
MGTQQLLLIVLGMIIVGVAIALAGAIFDSNSEKSLQEQIALESYHLACLAQQYYHKTLQLGGGGNNFTGWQINSNLDTTDNGIFKISNVSSAEITIVGRPLDNLKYTWAVNTSVTSQGITTLINYNN